MNEGIITFVDGVAMFVTPDGREYRWSDVQRHNHPKLSFDDRSGDVMASSPPRADAPDSGVATPNAGPDWSTGAGRNASKDKANAAVESLVPPNLRGLFSMVADMNPVRDMEQAGTAARGLFSPDASGTQRAGFLGDLLSNMAPTLGPVAAAKAGMPVANAIMEGLLGWAPGVDDAIARGLADESGALRLPDLMVGQHNLSPTGVEVSDAVGGIPMPSMAIARADAPLEQFGDVTLLARPDMVLPSRSVNVWPNDAYTGRQPRGEIQFANAKAAQAALKASPEFGHMRDVTYWMDAANDMADANEMMRTAQLGVAEGIDPKKYPSMWDYVRDVRAKLGYQSSEERAKMPGFAAYTDMERVLYPKEPFTPSGNRKRPQPYTLDSVMKRMGSDKAYTAGSEGWDYGPGSFRAQVTPKFSRPADVMAARGRLTSKAEFEPIADAFSNAYGSVRQDVEQYAKNPRLVYEAPEAIADLGRGGSASWFGDVPSNVRGYVDELARTASTMPTEYFEAKPKVAYSLGDFPAALVPESAPQAADILRRAGVNDVLTYGPNMSRAELIQRFPQLLFSAAAAGVPLGLLSMSPPEEQY
jgi:hypothetical protein